MQIYKYFPNNTKKGGNIFLVKTKKDTQPLVSIIPHPTEHIQMGGTKSEMRYADTIFLIVTCYLLPQGLETLLCLRYAFVLPSLQVRSHRWSINGLTTDLQRR